MQFPFTHPYIIMLLAAWHAYESLFVYSLFV